MVKKTGGAARAGDRHARSPVQRRRAGGVRRPEVGTTAGEGSLRSGGCLWRAGVPRTVRRAVVAREVRRRAGDGAPARRSRAKRPAGRALPAAPVLRRLLSSG